MAAKEAKYERVEKRDVDQNGRPIIKSVSEDRGGEDPALNFQDKRPDALVPGASAGQVPNISDTHVRDATSRISGNTSGFVEPSLSRTVIQGPTEHSSYSHHSKTSSSSDSSRKCSDSMKQQNLSGSGQQAAGYGSTVSSSSSGQKQQNMNMAGSGGSAAVTTQRTTVVTEHTVEGVGAQRTVPIQPHRQREDHEVIIHETRTRNPETTVITIPTTRFESAKLESTLTGVTYTEDKELTIPAPIVAPQIQHQMNINLGPGTHAEIHATTDFVQATEAQIKDMGPEEYARYRAKVEDLARRHEQEVAQKATAYREQVEKDADLIRQTLERQHMRDIEFRKELVESSVDRQQTEIKLEAEYAMRALEKEREAARAALEKAKMSGHIDVSIDSAIGTTHSEGQVTTTTERVAASRGPVTAASRI